MRAQHGQVPVSEILHTGTFSLEAAQQAPGWLAEINTFESEVRSHGHKHGHEREHSHATASSSAAAGGVGVTAAGKSANKHRTEADVYGISSFVYHAQRPFHPERLLDVALSVTWSGVLRTKVGAMYGERASMPGYALIHQVRWLVWNNQPYPRLMTTGHCTCNHVELRAVKEPRRLWQGWVVAVFHMCYETFEARAIVTAVDIEHHCDMLVNIQ